jgi:hypothetical protein
MLLKHLSGSARGGAVSEIQNLQLISDGTAMPSAIVVVTRSSEDGCSTESRIDLRGWKGGNVE